MCGIVDKKENHGTRAMAGKEAVATGQSTSQIEETRAVEKPLLAKIESLWLK